MLLDLKDVRATDFRKVAIRNFDIGIDTFGYSDEAFPQFNALNNIDFVESSVTHRDGKTLLRDLTSAQDGYGIVAGATNRLWTVCGQVVSAFNSGVAAAPTTLTSSVLGAGHAVKPIVSAKIPDLWIAAQVTGTSTNTVAYSYKIEDSTKAWTINQWVGYIVVLGNVTTQTWPIAKIASNTATELWFEADVQQTIPIGATYAIRTVIDGIIIVDPTNNSGAVMLKDIANDKTIPIQYFRATTATIAVPYKDRIFYAGVPTTSTVDQSNMLRWSERGIGTMVYAMSYLEIGSAGNVIYDMKEVNGMLCIFSAQGIYILKGTDAATFSLRSLSSIAPICAGAIAYGSNTVYFWAYDGIRRFTGYESLDLKPEFSLSQSIQSDIDAMSAADLSGMKSMLYKNKFITQIGEKRYVLNLKESRKNNRPVFTTETTANTTLQAVSKMMVLSEATVVADVPLVFSTTGKMYRDYYGMDDAGSAIVVTIRTNNINLSEEGVDKRVDTIKLMYPQTTITLTLTAKISYDNAAFATIGTTNSASDTMPKDILVRSSYCSSFAIELSGTIPTPLYAYGTTRKPIILSKISAFYTVKSYNLHTNK